MVSDRPHPRPLTVLHVCSIKGRGGTGYMASRLCRLLHERGHTVLVGACAGSKMEERARENGLELLPPLELRRGFRPLSLWRDVARLRRAIREHRVDVVHAWHSIEYWTSALAVGGTPARLARTRGLVTPIRPHVFNRWLHARTAALFATCGRIETNYRDAGLSMSNVYRLDDGVDANRFRPDLDGAPLRRELGLPEGAIVIASVGRLEPVKSQATVLDILPKLPPNVHLLFAGDGSLRSKLEARARDLGIADRAHFLGVRSDVECVLAASDIYVLCSIGSEGSSRATLEAMASGLPVVTTTVGMLPDVVKPGLTGLTFPPGDGAELGMCLENLIHDSVMRDRLGQQARALIEERHTDDAMARRVEDVYYRALGIKPGEAAP